MTASLAFYIAFYRDKGFDADGYKGIRSKGAYQTEENQTKEYQTKEYQTEEYQIKDDTYILEFYDAHKNDEASVLVKSVLSNTQFWDEDLTKIFPAEQFGGVSTIQALAAPYTMVKFMPTGGVNAKNLKDYLTCSKILCCGGSWMVNAILIKEGKFEQILEMTKEAVALVKSIRG